MEVVWHSLRLRRPAVVLSVVWGIVVYFLLIMILETLGDKSGVGILTSRLMTNSSSTCQKEINLERLNMDPSTRYIRLDPCYPGKDLSAKKVIEYMQVNLNNFSRWDLVFPSAGPYVLMRNKVFLCWIPKNSCTKFKQLAMRTVGIRSWDSREAKDIHRAHKEMDIGGFPDQAIKQIIMDPDWKRVAVLRDPKERFVSAYIDKVVNECNFKKNDNSCRKETAEDFFEFLSNESLWKANEHFAPQHQFCGFDNFWWVWNEIIYYESETIAKTSFESLSTHIEAELFENWPGNVSMWEKKTVHTTKSKNDDFFLLQNFMKTV